MAAKKNKLLRRPSSFTLFRDKPAGAATTLSVAAARGAATFTVSNAAGIAAGTVLRLGEGDEIERIDVTGVAGNVVTPAKPLLYAHAAADPAVEQIGYDLGDLDGGVEKTHAAEMAEIDSGNRRLRYDKIPGFQQFGVAVKVHGRTIANLCLALGIPLTRIFGTGVSAAQAQSLATDFNDVDSVDHQTIVATYVLMDGTVRTEEFMGVAVDASGLTTRFAIGDAGSVPMKFGCFGRGVAYDGAPGFTASATYRAGKGKLQARVSGVGAWIATGAGATTVNAAAAADANQLTVADASGIAAETWVAVNAGDLVELHWVDSKAANVLTLRTRLLRAQAVAVTVTPIIKSAHIAIAKGGADLAITAQTEAINAGDTYLPIAWRPGSVEASLEVLVQDLSLTTLLRALGKPATDLANNRIVLTENLGASPLLGAYVDGVARDGSVTLINLWGCAQDLAQLGTTYQKQGESGIRFKGQPASGFQIIQYAA